MFNRATELKKFCEEKNIPVYEALILKEMDSTNSSRSDIYSYITKTYEIMKNSATNGLEKEVHSLTGLTGGNAKRMQDYSVTDKPVTGEFLTNLMAMALSTSEVNSSMGRIVAAPTAGASGIVPAVLVAMEQKYNYSETEMHNALLTASAVGEIIAQNATISGAEGGCQAECGTAAAMATAAVVFLKGGTIDQMFDAAGFALKNIMGLICDPVAGLVEYPCNLRNASGAVNAVISADLAIAGVVSLIPFDEVVDAMYAVGKSLPESLRETAMGGIAVCPTALKINEKLFGKKNINEI